MKRLIALLLAAVMVVSLAACGSSTTTETAAEAATTAAATTAAATTAAAAQTATTAAATEAAATEEAADSVWNLEGTMFPLAEPVTFNMLTMGYTYADFANFDQCEDFKSLCEATNVYFNFEYLGEIHAEETATNFQMRIASGDYGDGIWSFDLNAITKADINDMAAAGIVLPFDEYMNNASVMPNFNEFVIKDNPYLTQAMKSDDGKIYGLYGLNSVAQYNSCEGLMQVNEAWLKAWQTAKGVDHTPETLAEFEDMLAYFHDNDMNGNGDATDEVPYFIAEQTYNGTSSLEASMGMFGIGQKSSAADMNIMIDDNGKCYYTYTTDAYKDALKTFGGWYQKGYIWSEIFTGNSDTILGVTADAANKIGVINTCYDTEGFTYLMPPTVEGYTAKYHTHPAVRNGIEGQAEMLMFDKCSNPEVFAAFFDLFYNLENNFTARYGTRAWTNGEITVGADGKYVMNVPSTPPEDRPDNERALYDFICVFSTYCNENMEKIDLESWLGDRACVKGAEAYTEAGIWNKTENLWPRCALLADKQDDYTFMYTDVDAALAEYRAKAVTGQVDIDSTWDAFQQNIKDLGVEDMIQIVQDSYDSYMSK